MSAAAQQIVKWHDDPSHAPHRGTASRIAVMRSSLYLHDNLIRVPGSNRNRLGPFDTFRLLVGRICRPSGKLPRGCPETAGNGP